MKFLCLRVEGVVSVHQYTHEINLTLNVRTSFELVQDKKYRVSLMSAMSALVDALVLLLKVCMAHIEE